MAIDIMPPREAEMQPEPEKQGPPNLRNALADASICGTCSEFQGMRCKKYGTPVKFHEGCDDHSDMREEEGDEEQEEAMPEAEDEVEG